MPWRMFAHDREGEFTDLGAYPYVKMHGLPYPIVEVEVAEVEYLYPAWNPEQDVPGTHWGWIKKGASVPIMIWPHWASFSVCFPYGPVAEEKAGRGRIVRLDVQRIAKEES